MCRLELEQELVWCCGLLKGAPLEHIYFPCLKIFPVHGHSFWDRLCILAKTFGIGLLLLMVQPTTQANIWFLRWALYFGRGCFVSLW